jgi:hypothetical protein
VPGKGPEARRFELEELADIYVSRGLPRDLAFLVAEKLTEHDVIAAHARSRLSIHLMCVCVHHIRIFARPCFHSIDATLPWNQPLLRSCS